MEPHTAYVESIQDIDADWMRKHKVDYIISDHSYPETSAAKEDTKSTSIIKTAIYKHKEYLRSFDWAVQCFVHGRRLEVEENE